MVGLVGKVSPSLIPMKYTAAPGGDGVGPPTWLYAAPARIREPNVGARIEARTLEIMTLDTMALEIMTLDIMALFPVVDCTMAVPDVGCGKDIPLTRDVNP